MDRHSGEGYLRLMQEAQTEYDLWEARFLANIAERKVWMILK